MPPLRARAMLPPEGKLSGVSTEVWGPKAWGFLHAIAFTYPTSPGAVEREAAYRLLVSFAHLLPCRKCRAHYKQYLEGERGVQSSGSPHLDSSESFSRWTVGLHNNVNERLGKVSMAYEEVVPLYSGTYLCPPDPVPHRRGNLISDLCGEWSEPERVLQAGLPSSVEECLAGTTAGATGVAVALVALALVLVVFGGAVSFLSRRSILRQLEDNLRRQQ